MAKPNKLWPMASKSCLVLEGNTVKQRVEAGRDYYKTPVHVDWLRFTALLRNAPAPSVDLLFPVAKSTNIWDERIAETARLLAELTTEAEFSAAAQAFDLAQHVAKILGDGFTVPLDIKRGQDFYKYRRSIYFNNEECGWVGYLASSEKGSHASNQANSLHVNLFGVACTFARVGWLEDCADLIDELDAKITRCDLALDFFDGYIGGIEKVYADYLAGVCNVGGRKLKFNQVGDWANGHDRSLYFGSRESGKITNIYEKGDQLHGHEFGSDWLRFELRYGNQVRSFSSDILRNPAGHFSGASAWHQALMIEADALTSAVPVPRNPRLPIETLEAEVSRSIRWFAQTAGPSAALAFQFLSPANVVAICEQNKLPGRLKKFCVTDVQAAFANAFVKVQKVLAVQASPAFA